MVIDHYLWLTDHFCLSNLTTCTYFIYCIWFSTETLARESSSTSFTDVLHNANVASSETINLWVYWQKITKFFIISFVKKWQIFIGVFLPAQRLSSCNWRQCVPHQHVTITNDLCHIITSDINFYANSRKQSRKQSRMQSSETSRLLYLSTFLFCDFIVLLLICFVIIDLICIYHHLAALALVIVVVVILSMDGASSHWICWCFFLLHGLKTTLQTELPQWILGNVGQDKMSKYESKAGWRITEM